MSKRSDANRRLWWGGNLPAFVMPERFDGEKVADYRLRCKAARSEANSRAWRERQAAMLKKLMAKGRV